MARNKGESTVFKGSISSTTYCPTNFFNSPPLTGFAPKSSFCCLGGGGPPALVTALSFAQPGGTVSLTVQMFLQISRCVFEAR